MLAAPRSAVDRVIHFGIDFFWSPSGSPRVRSSSSKSFTNQRAINSEITFNHKICKKQIPSNFRDFQRFRCNLDWRVITKPVPYNEMAFWYCFRRAMYMKTQYMDNILALCDVVVYREREIDKKTKNKMQFTATLD